MKIATLKHWLQDSRSLETVATAYSRLAEAGKRVPDGIYGGNSEKMRLIGIFWDFQHRIAKLGWSLAGGKLGGHRWGLSRRSALLSWEARQTNPHRVYSPENPPEILVMISDILQAAQTIHRKDDSPEE